MAIVLDASSPALVADTADGTLPTASFSPPAQSLLAAMVGAFSDSVPSVAGGGLTWTRRIQRIDGLAYAEIWTAPCPAGASNIQVTLTSTGFMSSFSSALKVDVYTGCDLTTPAGGSGQGASTTNNVTVNAYTATVVGSRGVAVGLDRNQLGLPSSTDDESAFNLTNLTGLAVRKSANTASLTNVQVNLDAFGTGTPDWQWVALELLPAAEALVAGRGVMLGQAGQRAAFY